MDFAIIRHAVGGRRIGEALAFTGLVVALWIVPAMVSQGQDRPAGAPALMQHVDAPLIGHDAAAGRALETGDKLALDLAKPAAAPVLLARR